MVRSALLRSSRTTRSGRSHWSDLKSRCQSEPHRQRLRGMNMAIGNSADRLARQPQQIIIFVLFGLRVEQIEPVELQPKAVIEFVARPRVEDQRSLRTHAVILDQGTRPEIARPQRAKPAG